MSQLFGLQHRGDGEFDTFLSLLKGQVIQAAVDHYNEMQQNKKNANGTSANNGLFSTENDDIQMMAESNKGLSKTLETIDEAIKTGNWSNEALEELENLNIDNYGKILKRFSQEELRSSDGILT